MKKSLLSAATSMLGVALALPPVANLQAAELNVLAGGAMTGPMQELGTQFERASGHKLVFRFGTTPELIKLATSGGPFDLGVVPVDVMKDAAARARFAAGPTIDIARVGLGVAVRAGAPKPDIGTSDALKQTLLKAQSVASILESAAGSQVLRVFERLGITEAMKAKVKSQAAPAQLVQAVANGEVELGVFLTNVLITSAVAADAKQAEAARAFITFLQAPAAAAVLKAKGMNPA
jgi:molybdate transport system substrate-binding protein